MKTIAHTIASLLTRAEAHEPNGDRRILRKSAAAAKPKRRLIVRRSYRFNELDSGWVSISTVIRNDDPSATA